jgi:hypothetical protein
MVLFIKQAVVLSPIFFLPFPPALLKPRRPSSSSIPTPPIARPRAGPRESESISSAAAAMAGGAGGRDPLVASEIHGFLTCAGSHAPLHRGYLFPLLFCSVLRMR